MIESTTGPLDITRAAPGRRLLRWWFPRASTPHCLLQARALTASWARLSRGGLDVVGLSFDSLAVLADWSADLDAPYPFAHADLELADQLGAARPPGDPWREVLARRVFDLIDEHGTVLARAEVADVDQFLPQVLALSEGGPT